LKLILEDYDLMNNDFLGTVDISLKRVFHYKNQWISYLGQKLGDREKVDKNVPISGSISCHLKYVPEGDSDDNIEPELEKMPQIIIEIEKAIDLRNLDSFGAGTSDPYVELTLENYLENFLIKTKIIENDCNPIWNHKDII